MASSSVFVLVALLAVLLEVRAHPPMDVPLNDSTVVSAAEHAVAAMNASFTSSDEGGETLRSWELLSARRQLVNG